jgi:polyamine oxidase
VLASGVVQFSPPLPTTKSDALAALPMGLLDKLWLTFDDVFWNPDVDIINFIDPENPGLWAQWVNGYRAFGTPTLLAFNSSSVARRVANWSDEEVVGSAINAIARMA